MPSTPGSAEHVEELNPLQGDAQECEVRCTRFEFDLQAWWSCCTWWQRGCQHDDADDDADVPAARARPC